MTEKHIRLNGVNTERGTGVDTLVRAGAVLSHVLLIAFPRQLTPVEVMPPGVGKTLYTRPDRTDSRRGLRGRHILERRQPRQSEAARSLGSHRGRGGNLLRQS